MGKITSREQHNRIILAIFDMFPLSQEIKVREIVKDPRFAFYAGLERVKHMRNRAALVYQSIAIQMKEDEHLINERPRQIERRGRAFVLLPAE